MMSKLNLSEKVRDWWDNMDDNYKYEIMEGYYPDKAHLLDLTEMWEGVGWENQLEIYNSSEGEVDLEAQRADAAERENHREDVEGEIE